MSGAAEVAHLRHDDQPPLLKSARAAVWQNVRADPNFARLTSTEKRALGAAVLARIGGEGWFVWKREEWGRAIGVKPRQMTRIIGRLEAFGFLTREVYWRPAQEGGLGAEGAPNLRLDPRFLEAPARLERAS